jgi:hypothetical protein
MEQATGPPPGNQSSVQRVASRSRHGLARKSPHNNTRRSERSVLFRCNYLGVLFGGWYRRKFEEGYAVRSLQHYILFRSGPRASPTGKARVRETGLLTATLACDVHIEKIMVEAMDASCQFWVGYPDQIGNTSRQAAART